MKKKNAITIPVSPFTNEKKKNYYPTTKQIHLLSKLKHYYVQYVQDAVNSVLEKLHEAHNDQMARDEQKKKYTHTQQQKKNLIMQIIFPISLFHMNRSLFHNPVKRASHRSLSLCIREHPKE